MEGVRKGQEFEEQGGRLEGNGRGQGGEVWKYGIVGGDCSGNGDRCNVSER